MFTGIITHRGTILSKSAGGLKIQAGSTLINQLDLGDSVAVNGACLTVTKIFPGQAFLIDVMPETFDKTMLGSLVPGSAVNLELPLAADGRFAGHIVQGHIDGVAVIKDIKRVGNSRVFTFSAPKNILDYMVEKGSVCLNGISLTLISLTSKEFSVGIIPHTWERTTMRLLKIGDKVNVEPDILAKYIKKFTVLGLPHSEGKCIRSPRNPLYLES